MVYFNDCINGIYCLEFATIKILILLSALQGIDKQYYQAAQIDGSSKMRIFTKITVPLLSPQIFYLLITSFIGAFKEYTSVVAIFGDNAQSVGQRNNMATVVWYIYKKPKRVVPRWDMRQQELWYYL